MMKTFKQFILSEIILTVDQPDNQLASYVRHITDEQPFGRFEDFMVYKGKIDNKIALVARKEDKEKTFIGYVIGDYINVDGRKYWQSNYTYFDKQYRGKGFATALIQFILHKMAVPIISDTSQSKHGKMLWQSLMKKNKHSVYDRKEKKFLDLKDVPMDQLYSTNDELGKRFSLVIEEAHMLSRRGPPSTIFHEHVIYTNPENKYL